MSSIRGRLNRIITRADREAAKPLAGAAYAEASERFHRECDAWQKAFVRGTVLPLPVHAGCGWEISRARLVPGACVMARLHRVIPPTDYLAGMTREERGEADAFCGALWAANEDCIAAGSPADDPAELIEFEALWQLRTERNGTCRTFADDSAGSNG